jgi:hypothetical protein
MIPSVEASQEMIQQIAVDIATTILGDRGIGYSIAKNPQQAETIKTHQVDRFLAEEDLQAAGASLLQIQSRRTEDDSIDAQMKDFAVMLIQMGDDLYYDHGNVMEALVCYQLALGLDPNNQEALNEAVAVCTPQGDATMAEAALPYAVVLRYLNPTRDSVHYLQQLIEQQ